MSEVFVRVNRTYTDDQGNPLTHGRPTFVCSAVLVDGVSVSDMPVSIRCSISSGGVTPAGPTATAGQLLGPDGNIGVLLVANDSLSPSPSYYTISGEPSGSTWTVQILSAMAPSVNLASLAPTVPGPQVFQYALQSSLSSYVGPLVGTPTSGQVPEWNGTQWVPATGGSGTVTITSPDSSITVGGSTSSPTLEVEASLQTAISSNTSAITSETSRATTAEGLLAPKASPSLTGTPTAPTPAALDNSTKLATTAYADSAVGVEKTRAQSAEGTNATAVSTETSRAEAAEALLAPLASPALTGTPTAPTKPAATNNTDIATTAYTDAAVLVETTRATTAEGLKAPLASPALTGTPTAPTAAPLTNTTQLGTTAYTDAAVAVEKTRALAAEGTNATSISTETSRATTAEGTKLPLAGGTMSGAIAMGANKVTGLANGTVSSDAAAFGQIPTALPPNGSASGDLSGSFPSPVVAKINGTALSGLATGLLKNTTSTGVPSIAVASDIPTVAAGGTGALSATDTSTTNSRAPNGSASGDLSSNYPSPTVVKINGTSLSALATGLLKNTTGTGVPSIAVASDIPIADVGSAGPVSATSGAALAALILSAQMFS